LTQNIAINLVYVENKVRATASRIFVTSLIGLVIAVLLSSKYGAIGAAVGTCAGLCIYQIWINHYFYKSLGLDVIRFFEECHFKILPLLILYTGIFYYFVSYFDNSNWISLIIQVAIYASLFIIICRYFLFYDEEKNYLSLSNKLKKK
jgi:O-antigen/teichoic acid export membrane protein